jgi:DNA primase small subunit
VTFLSYNDEKFVKNEFKNFYSKFNNISFPKEIEKREFGYFTFEQNIMVRHLKMKNQEEILKLIKSVTPLHIYYSSAFYEDPSAPMEKKGWNGAELIFDIDADHIVSDCQKEHKFWICNNCKESGMAPIPKKCPICKSDKINEIDWFCDKCLTLAKNEAIKLIEILEIDFGIQSKNINVFFSGHRGYHIHIDSEYVRKLDQNARREIVDYLIGEGIDFSRHGIYKPKRSTSFIGPDYDSKSWSGRIARGIYDIFLRMKNPSFEEYFIENLGKSTYKNFLNNLENLIELWHEKPVWSFVPNIKKKDIEKICMLALKEQAIKLDTIVTTDIHRLIRLGNSLNGKTGWICKEIDINKLESFDPLISPSPFDYENYDVKIKVFSSPKFRFGQNFFGPYKNKIVKLPLAIAIFLICKGVASLYS